MPTPDAPLVSMRLWNLALAALFAVLLIGLGVALLISRGAADPPMDNLIHLDFITEGSAAVPFTLETTAPGFDITCGSSPTLHVQVRRDGYFSVNADEPDWQEFMHIRRERNHLYWHMALTGLPVLRINDEIAWTGEVYGTICHYSTLSDS